VSDLYFLQVFATPETAVGLFPDVGASYFLSRLPGFFGNGGSISFHNDLLPWKIEFSNMRFSDISVIFYLNRYETHM